MEVIVLYRNEHRNFYFNICTTESSFAFFNEHLSSTFSDHTVKNFHSFIYCAVGDSFQVIDNHLNSEFKAWGKVI